MPFDLPRIHRRELLQWLAGTASTAGTPAALAAWVITDTGDGCADDARWRHAPLDSPSGDPFTLGVASGDPLPDGIVLWTRLAPEPFAPRGGMPERPVALRWEMSRDEDFAQIERAGVVDASPEWGHSVRIDVRSLDPNTTYFYRFRHGHWVSPTGRTRTLPRRTSSPDALSFAVTCCQNWQQGHWAGHEHLSHESDLAFVLFLGDYIYEHGPIEGIGPRQHTTPEATDLASYRARYAEYKSDPALQASHAAHPWLVLWDDHEVQNNYAADAPFRGEPSDAWNTRRAAAYQAFFEHHPIRISAPRGAELDVYRSLQFGDLASFSLLDTRQYRDPQACGGHLGADCDELTAPDRTLLGPRQRDWLLDRLRRPEGHWTFIASQLVMTNVTMTTALTDFTNPDQWDGYPAERQRILDTIAHTGLDNVVVLSGDVHASAAAYLTEDGADPSSPPIAYELACGPMSSKFPDLGWRAYVVDFLLPNQDNVAFFDRAQKGYLRVDADREAVIATWRMLDDAEDPVSEIYDGRVLRLPAHRVVIEELA